MPVALPASAALLLFLFLGLHLGEQEPWGLGDLAAQIEHRQSGDHTEAEEEPPDEVVGHPGLEEGDGYGRADDQAGALHREHQRHHPAPVRLAGVLAQDRGADRVVTADADPQDRPERQKPPEPHS